MATGNEHPSDVSQLRQLHQALSLNFQSDKDAVLTRENAIRLLEQLASALDPLMAINTSHSPGDVETTISHPSVDLLVQLTDVLRDLDNGKTHEVLKPNPYGATASLSKAERKQHELWSAAVLIAQRHYGFKSLAKATQFVANRLKLRAYKRSNGKPISPEFLRKLFYYQTKNRSETR